MNSPAKKGTAEKIKEMIENRYLLLKSTYARNCVREYEVFNQEYRITIPRITLKIKKSQKKA